MEIDTKIELINFNQAEKAKIVEVFNESFSDYVIPLQFNYKDFYKRMENEGINYQYSYVAIKNDKYIGLIVTNINTIGGIEHFRCGVLGVIKDYRLQNVAKLLMEKQKKIFKQINIDEFELECIATNNRALCFYEKENFKIKRELHYFYRPASNIVTDLELGTFENLNKFILENDYYLDYQTKILLSNYKELEIRQITEENKIIGMAACNGNKLAYIAVKHKYQNQGYGSKLLSSLNYSNELQVVTSNDQLIHRFLKKNKFLKKDLFQYVLTLDK